MTHEGATMRVNAKWTVSEMALWLIAAIIATVLVCSEHPSRDEAPESPRPSADEVEFEVETPR